MPRAEVPSDGLIKECRRLEEALVAEQEKKAE